MTDDERTKNLADALKMIANPSGMTAIPGAQWPKQLPQMSILRGRKIEHPSKEEDPRFFYHGRAVSPDTILGRDKPVSVPEQGRVFTPAFPDTGFERDPEGHGFEHWGGGPHGGLKNRTWQDSPTPIKLAPIIHNYKVDFI